MVQKTLRHLLLPSLFVSLLVMSASPTLAGHGPEYVCTIGTNQGPVCIDDAQYGDTGGCDGADWYNGWDWVYVHPTDDTSASAFWSEGCGRYGDDIRWESSVIYADVEVAGYGAEAGTRNAQSSDGSGFCQTEAWITRPTSAFGTVLGCPLRLGLPVTGIPGSLVP